MEVKNQADELTVCSSVALKKGYFNDLLIVDSNRNAFPVIGVKQIGYIGPLWGFSLFYSRKLRVQLLLDNPSLLALEEIKSLACRVVEGDSDFWAASSGDHMIIINSIKNAGSFSELITALNY